MAAQTKIRTGSLLRRMGQIAAAAARELATYDDEVRSRALKRAAEAVLANKRRILEASAEDVERSQHLSAAMVDRLKLDDARLKAMADGLRQIAELPNCLGRRLATFSRPNGLVIERVSVPLGVIGMIFESRPNVTADAAGLCVKSANAVILRCGSESIRSCTAIADSLAEGLTELPTGVVQLIPTADRKAVDELLALNEFVDLIIPRGGKSLVEKVSSASSLPVLYHLEGICHTYIHKSADRRKAVEVTYNAKMRRPGICGATETILLDEECLESGVAAIVAAKLLENGCEVRGDRGLKALDKRIAAATDKDWETEYLAPIVSVKTVTDQTEAVAHILRYGSNHTEAIIAEDKAAVEYFFAHLDSAILMHNASTQFADGGEFGMGAEIGIATGKLHARGPVGVEQLTTYKYLVRGDGQTRP